MPCARHFYVYLPPDASLRCLGTRLLSLIPTVAAGLNRRAFGLPSPRIRGLGPRATRTAVLGAGHLAKLEPRQSREIGFYEAVRALLQISPTERRTGEHETYTARARGLALVCQRAYRSAGTATHSLGSRLAVLPAVNTLHGRRWREDLKPSPSHSTKCLHKPNGIVRKASTKSDHHRARASDASDTRKHTNRRTPEIHAERRTPEIHANRRTPEVHAERAQRATPGKKDASAQRLRPAKRSEAGGLNVSLACAVTAPRSVAKIAGINGHL
jgi:hypothetical protein